MGNYCMVCRWWIGKYGCERGKCRGPKPPPPQRTFDRHFALRKFYVETQLADEACRLSGWRSRTSRLGFILDRCRDGEVSSTAAAAEYDAIVVRIQQRLDVVRQRQERVGKMTAPGAA